MKLGKQGEINVLPLSSALAFESKPTEINKPEGKEPFTGQIIVQPHSVKLIWEVLEGKRDRIRVRSGQNLLSIIYQKEKNRVRIKFISDDKESSYILFDKALNRFKDQFLKAVKEAGIVSVRDNGFVSMRIGDNIVLRNDKLEYYLNKEQAKKLKEFILNNYILKEPVVMTGKIGIDEEKNIVYKGLKIPPSIVKELILFVL